MSAAIASASSSPVADIPSPRETLRDVLTEDRKHLLDIDGKTNEIKSRLGLPQAPPSVEKSPEVRGALHLAVDLRSGLITLEDLLDEILTVL